MNSFTSHILTKSAPFVFLALTWELIGRFSSSELLPPLSAVIVDFASSLWQGEAAPHVRSTVWKLAVSFGIGSLAGVVFGIVIGWFRMLESYFQPLIYFTYALPRVALIPLFILWVGIGDRTVIIAAAVAVFYLVLVNTINGVKQVDPIFIRAARNLGANQFQLMTKVMLPASVVPIFAGIRLGIGQALVSVVSGEIIIGETGLGYWIWNARYRMEISLVFVNLIWLALLGLLITHLAHLLEQRTHRGQSVTKEPWL